MENKKICVAIDTRNDKRNIIRTVNSIKRQTAYESVLMVVLYDEGSSISDISSMDEAILSETEQLLNKIDIVENLKELKTLLEEKHVDKLMFVNTEIVMAPNAIEQLLSDDSNEQLILNHLVVDSKGDYVRNEKTISSPYCKVFIANELFGMEMDGTSLCVSHNLQLRYSFLGKKLKTVNAYAYQCEDIDIGIDYETEYDYIKSLLANESIVGIDVVTDTIENILYKALRESLDKENASAFVLLQKCVETLTFDDDILQLEYKKYKITPELFEIIGRCDVSQFKKMYQKFGALGAKNNAQMQVVEEQTNNYNPQQLVNLQNTIKNLEIRINSLEQEQNGYVAAQNVVGMYKDGKLGMGTIFKSIVAWIKYKVSGKR